MKLGWSKGAEIGEQLWTELKSLIPMENQMEAAERICLILESYDCDCLADDAENLWIAAGRNE